MKQYFIIGEKVYMEYKALLQEIQNTINTALGGVVDKVILFGSRAHGTQTEFSDYDVMIILNCDYTWELERVIYDICYDIDLKYDIIIDAKIINHRDLDSIRGKQPFVQDALQTGVAM